VGVLYSHLIPGDLIRNMMFNMTIVLVACSSTLIKHQVHIPQWSHIQSRQIKGIAR